MLSFMITNRLLCLYRILLLLDYVVSGRRKERIHGLLKMALYIFGTGQVRWHVSLEAAACYTHIMSRGCAGMCISAEDGRTTAPDAGRDLRAHRQRER
jgi:hypothetical protein